MSCRVVSASYLVEACYVIIFTRIFSAETSRLLVRLWGAHARRYLPQWHNPRMHSRNTLCIPYRCLPTKPMLLSQTPSLLSDIFHFFCVPTSSVNSHSNICRLVLHPARNPCDTSFILLPPTRTRLLWEVFLVLRLSAVSQPGNITQRSTKRAPQSTNSNSKS